METDEVNVFKTVCKEFFHGEGFTVYFDTPISDEITWRPHIFATDHQKLILDIITFDTLPDFYLNKYIEIRNYLSKIQIYIGLVGDLNYYPEIISKCAQNGIGIYKINNTMKLLLEASQPTIKSLSDRGQIAIVFGRPYKNVLALKRCLRVCRSHLYWFERNLPKKAFETVFNAIEDADMQHVETIRFLRGLDDKVTASFRGEFLKFKEDILTYNIESQLRIICDSSIIRRVHGRYIYSEDENKEHLYIKLPPLNSLKANQWDTILTDASEIPSFQEFWDSGLDIQSSWNEIKTELNRYIKRRAEILEEQAGTLRSRLEPTKGS